MNHFGALIIFFFIFIHGKAQVVSNYEPEVPVLHPFHPGLIATIGVLATMLFLIILILAYAKVCHTNQFRSTNHDQNLHGLVRTRSRFSGFDKTVIESLPFFRFSSLKGSKEGLECAVCLSKFEETEMLRLLPKCKHAFHMNCIDQWLESHSSCPLCRHKFDAGDVSNFAYSSSLRFSQNPSNLTDDPNLEVFVQRSEQGLRGSSRFSSFRGKSDFGERDYEELPIQDCNTSNVVDGKFLDKFKHKIIVSDAVIQNRWSDVNSSDLLFLNSEMMNVTASERFSSSGRQIHDSTTGNLMNEQMMKIKEDIEKKRLFDSKFTGINRNNSISNLNSPSTSSFEEKSLHLFNPADKRSKSEITNISRFMEFSTRNSSKGSPSNDRKEERLRRIWLPIAQRTVQWFALRERSSQDGEYKRHPSNV